MTYNEQFNKLTAAYINDEVNPYDQCACFVGNLLNNNGNWADERKYTNTIEHKCIPGEFASYTSVIDVLHDESDDFYTPDEIDDLERNFLKVYQDEGGRRTDSDVFNEDALFKAFESTLNILKDIHLSRGEIIDNIPVFKQRELQTV